MKKRLIYFILWILVATLAFSSVMYFKYWKNDKTVAQTVEPEKEPFKEVLVALLINGKLDSAIYQPAKITILKNEIAVFKVVSGTMYKKVHFPLFGSEEIISPQGVISVSLPGNKTVLRLNSEITTIRAKEKGNIVFGTNFLTLVKTTFATICHSEPAELEPQPVVIQVRIYGKDKYQGEWFEAKPVETTQEQLLPDSLKVEEKKRDFDLREKAKRGLQDLEEKLFDQEPKDDLLQTNQEGRII